jgi:hypothetical protein
MSCCGKKRKPSDPSRPTLASPIGVLKPRVLNHSAANPSTLSEPRRGDARRDASVTDGR